jgi:hypothetical protein
MLRDVDGAPISLQNLLVVLLRSTETPLAPFAETAPSMVEGAKGEKCVVVDTGYGFVPAV